MADTITIATMPSIIASHAMRPRTPAPWAPSAYASSTTTTGTAFTTKVGSGNVGVDAGVRGADVRDLVALQGAPPRENPR